MRADHPFNCTNLTNHLGNVLSTISDRKRAVAGAGGLIASWQPELMSCTDYYPFGMQMEGRGFASNAYRWGFNGKEKDDEIKGAGNSIDYGFRMHDPRIGRFLSIDPLFKTYPWYTPYQYAGNSPIAFIDLDGLERVLAITFNGDVNYRAERLELLNAGDITKKTLTTDPGTQLAQAFIDASAADENGIGFVAIWGHGTSDYQWGTASNSTGMEIDDLGALRTAIENGDVSFTDNAIIYIGNCNSGTCNSDGSSFAQEMADITGARVIGGEGSVGVKDESNGNMEYTMYYPKTQNFKMFEARQTPIKLGGTMNIQPLLERGKTMPIEKMKLKEIKSISIDTPEPTIQTR